MTPLTVYPDVDIVAHTILRAGLAERGVTVGVASALPSPPPDRFVRCFSLPGQEVSRRTMWCQVVVQVYDVDEVRCSDVARLCGAILRAAPDSGDPPVCEPSELLAVFPSPDPDVPAMARYQVNATWTVQSSVA